MRRTLLLVVVTVSSAVALASCGGGASSRGGAGRQWIPASAREKIETSYPLLAYGPGWLPSNYRFSGYTPGFYPGSPADFAVGFHSTAVSGYPRADWLGWDVMEYGNPLPRPCASGSMKDYRLHGVTVYWAGTYTDQEAWRCIKRGGKIIWLQASGSFGGDDSLNTPRRRHDAFVLAKAVAYATPLR